MAGRLSGGEGLRNNAGAVSGRGPSRFTELPARRDTLFGGGDHIAGVVEINGVPSRGKVFVHDQASKLVVAGGWTDAFGAFRFNNLSPTLNFYIVAFDPVTGEQAAVYDRI